MDQKKDLETLRGIVLTIAKSCGVQEALEDLKGLPVHEAASFAGIATDSKGYAVFGTEAELDGLWEIFGKVEKQYRGVQVPEEIGRAIEHTRYLLWDAGRAFDTDDGE